MSKKEKKTVKVLLEEALVSEQDQQYKVPANWVWVKLGAVATLINGYAFKSKDYSDEGIPVIRISDVNGNIQDLSSAVRVPHSKYNERYLINKGDLLIAMSGATTGKTGIFDSDEVALQNQRVGNIKERDTKVLYKKYKNFFIQKSKDEILKLAYGGAQPNISGKLIEELHFPLPPIIEQKRIADKVDHLLNKIDKVKQFIDEAKETFELRRAAILDKAFHGELTTKWREQNPHSSFTGETLKKIQDERQKAYEKEKKLAKIENRKVKYNKPSFLGDVEQENLPDLPKSWSYVYLGNITEVVRGGSPRPAGDPKYFNGDIPWITVAEITKDDNVYLNSVSAFVTEEGMKRSRFIEEGTLLLSNSGATLGVPKITKISGCINDGSVAFIELFKVSKLFLYYFLYSQTKKLRNLNQGAAQPNLNTDIVKHIIVPFPPYDEQLQIVEVLERTLNLESMTYSAIEIEMALNQLKKSILSKAFRGELGTNNQNEESAFELLKEVFSKT